MATHPSMNQPVYGWKIQYAEAPDISIYLDTKGYCLIQSIVSAFLYYAQVIDGIALPALNDIGNQQSKPTKNTTKDTSWLMDYFHTCPNAHQRFFASDMQLHVDSNAAYLVMPGAKSCFVGYFYLASHPHPLNYNGTLHTAPILVECYILKSRCVQLQRQNAGVYSIT
eukprot:15366461-Ditylum_brightwellii.AAC.1